MDSRFRGSDRKVGFSELSNFSIDNFFQDKYFGTKKGRPLFSRNSQGKGVRRETKANFSWDEKN